MVSNHHWFQPAYGNSKNKPKGSPRPQLPTLNVSLQQTGYNPCYRCLKTPLPQRQAMLCPLSRIPGHSACPSEHAQACTMNRGFPSALAVLLSSYQIHCMCSQWGSGHLLCGCRWALTQRRWDESHPAGHHGQVHQWSCQLARKMINQSASILPSHHLPIGAVYWRS